MRLAAFNISTEKHHRKQTFDETGRKIGSGHCRRGFQRRALSLKFSETPHPASPFLIPVATAE